MRNGIFGNILKHCGMWSSISIITRNMMSAFYIGGIDINDMGLKLISPSIPTRVGKDYTSHILVT